MTYAVTDGPYVELVGVSPSVALSEAAADGEVEGSDEGRASEAGAASLVLSETVSYEGVSHIVSSVGAYAFYLSGVTDVTLPASVSNVDDRAFRSSDVASVAVVEGNHSYSSYDGALYDADQSSLLLIPEGKQGAVRIPAAAKAAPPSAFSHCAGVDAIAADADGAAFASENGLLYTSDLTTLLRVPAGATEITIHEGCITIAAGALEACAKLITINAPSTVTSISPDVLTAISTVSLLAASLTGTNDLGASGEPSSQGAALQITAMVALSTADDDLPEVDLAAITAALPEGADEEPWRQRGFSVTAVSGVAPEASGQERDAYASNGAVNIYTNGHPIPVLQHEIHGGASFKTTWIMSDRSVFTVPAIRLWYYGRTPTGPNGEYVGQYGFFVADGYPDAGNNYFSYGFDPWGRHSPTGKESMDPGYTCAGLSTNNSPTGIISEDGLFHYSGITLYVLWRAHTYTINLDSQGGSPAGPVAATYDQNVTLPQPTRESHNFLGWDTEPDGTGVRIAPGQPARNLTAQDGGNVTLYAQWAPDYFIHFDGNVVDDPEHPATVPDDIPAVRDEQVDLPEPTRFGYIFKGWATHPFGSTAGGHKVFVPGEKAVNLTNTPGDTVTLYALWALKYDADVPICSPSDMTFALDTTGTGDVRAIPADYEGDYSFEDMSSLPSTHSAAIESRMAVPVAVESVSASAVEGDGFSKVLSSTDDSPADEQLSFTVASGDAKASVKAGESKELANLMVPEASDATPTAKLSLAYGLELADTAVVLANDGKAAVPVAKVSYTLDIIDGMASKWGFFMLDGGTPVTPTRIKAAADDIAEADHAGDVASSGYYGAFRDALDTRTPFYLRVDDQPDGGFSVHEMDLLGIAQDTLSTARKDDSGATIATKAGLTFGLRDIYAQRAMVSAGGTSGNWELSDLRQWLNSDFFDSMASQAVYSIAEVMKRQQRFGGSGTEYLQATDEVIFVPSAYEVFGRSFVNHNDAEAHDPAPFQYEAFASGVSVSSPNPAAIKAYEGSVNWWWLRSARRTSSTYFCSIDSTGAIRTTSSSLQGGVVPCFAV